MLIVWRWWYFLGLGGIGLLGYGGLETHLAMQSGAEPLAVTMADFAGGKEPAQPYVRIGQHAAIHLHSAYMERRKKVERVVHPIVGMDHSFMLAMTGLEREYGNLADVPPSKLPALTGVQVLVEGKQLPPENGAAIEAVDSIEGTLFRYPRTSSDTRDLVDKVLGSSGNAAVFVLEKGRRPYPLATTITFMVGGVVLLWGAVVMYRRPTAATA